MENDIPANNANLIQNNKKSEEIEIKLGNKIFPLEISLDQDNIIFNIQEKYNLYFHRAKFTYQDFLNKDRIFRIYDTLNEIYSELIKGNITIKDFNSNNNETIILNYKININKKNYEINFTLNKKEMNIINDKDIIISNYNSMKKELNELKDLINRFKIVNISLFYESIWLKNNYIRINLIEEGINHQLKKKIQSTFLLYRYTINGHDHQNFHKKCDGIENTLIYIKIYKFLFKKKRWIQLRSFIQCILM